MPVTLRRRLQCHYCGKRLNTAKRVGDRIPCDQCSADNYFDVDHNIIDVPETAVNHPNLRTQLSEIESESDVFCKKCLTNQAFYVQALSNYLPDESDPQYSRLLDELPEYERRLELRYPQCCAECEPRVATRIQEANYMAKSDHLRRVLHRKHDRTRAAQLRFRRFLISTAGIGYAVSLMIQLFWHALASQVNSQYIVPGITPTQCFRYWPVPSQCTNYVSSFLPLSLLIGLLCIWWNPQWQDRLAGREGRLVGLSKYYQIQSLVLVLRFAAWAMIQDLPALQGRAHAVHTVLLILLSTVSVYAITSIVKVDTTPLVDWQQVQAPLVKFDQFRPPSQMVASPPSSQGTSKLNIADFAAPTSTMYEPWKPPTPPTEDDSMDWTPSMHDFNPQPRLPKPKFEQETPFYGTLPAAPVRGSLNPKVAPPPTPRKALGLPPGFFGLSKSQTADRQVVQSQSSAGDAFAPAKFFPDKRETDTGLENIFDKMFFVRDPSETSSTGHKKSSASIDIFSQQRPGLDQRQQLRSSTQDQHGRTVQPLFRMGLSVTIMLALGVIMAILCSLEFLFGAITSSPSTILPYTASIPIVHLLEEMYYTNQIELASLAISMTEISLSAATHVLLPDGGSDLVPVWNKMAIGVICFFMLQEIYHFCQLLSTSASRQLTQVAVPVGDTTSQDTLQQQERRVEEIQLSHPSSQQRPQHAPPTQITGNPFSNKDYSTIRKRDSDESISSVSSVNTTSTASGWKTPQNTSRTFDWQSGSRPTPRHRTSNVSMSLGGLSLGNDFGSGANIAGPRNRQRQGSGNGSYRS